MGSRRDSRLGGGDFTLIIISRFYYHFPLANGMKVKCIILFYPFRNYKVLCWKWITVLVFKLNEEMERNISTWRVVKYWRTYLSIRNWRTTKSWVWWLGLLVIDLSNWEGKEDTRATEIKNPRRDLTVAPHRNQRTDNWNLWTQWHFMSDWSFQLQSRIEKGWRMVLRVR